jgi:integrase
MSGRLTARKVQTASPGKYADGSGLYLIVAPNGARRWFFIFTLNARRPEMSLGRFPDVSLAEAREAAAAARRLLRAGVNPIEARRVGRSGAATFGQLADEYFATKQGEYRNAKYREMVRVALTRTAAPLRPLAVDAIDTEAVLAALKPVWERTPETGKRLREKIEAVLDMATAKGLRTGENPARWRGHLSHLLPKRQSLARGHFAAMNYRDVPAFMARLREQQSIAERALEFTILTAARSNEVYGARWSEVSFDENLWTIPRERTKSAREHRVPLSGRAIEILRGLEASKTCDLIFPSPRAHKPLSHIAMAQALSRMGVTDATVHGFRSSFRDWVGNETHFPREVAEAALAHVVGDKAEQAYRRGDALEKRRALMDAWAVFCGHCAPQNIVKLSRSWRAQDAQ